MNTLSESTGEAEMDWLKWREALKPGGRYNRGQFLFWFFIPIICLILIVTHIWELEKLLIKLSYYVGLLGLNVGPIATFLSVLSAVFLAYVIIVAMIKRCHDLYRSGWWVLSAFILILGIFFPIYLMLWPGKTQADEPRSTKWTRAILLSLAVISILVMILISLLLFFGRELNPPNKAAPFRVWNQNNQLLNVQIIASDGVVHQGYFFGEAAPNKIIRNENILLGRGAYTVKTRSARGDVVYSKDFTSGELAELDWIVVIPPTPTKR